MATASSQGPETISYDEQRRASLEVAAPRINGYEVLEFLGAGTYGDVWKARASATGIPVAIKRLRSEPDALACEEIDKLRKLSSARGIVTLRDVHLSATPYCYVMEYVPGGTLADLIRSKGPLPLADAWRIFRQIIDALAYVHKEGIVHCDIKPENILMDADGQPRLGDFGQARGKGPKRASLGTRFYMPPEQARMEMTHDPRWDVYALGAILFEMLTGQKPRFDPELSQLMSTPTRSGSEIRRRLVQYAEHLEAAPMPAAHRRAAKIDRWKAALIDDCLALEFDKRPRDAAEVRRRIAECDHASQSRPLMIFGGIAPAVMLLLFGVTVLIAGSLAFRNLSKQWAELTKANNPAAVKEVANEIEGLFNSAAKVVQEESAAVESALLTGNDSDASQKKVMELFDKYKEQDSPDELQIDRWFLADANGKCLANYGRIPPSVGGETIGVDQGSIGLDYAWRGWFNGDQDREPSVERRPQDLKNFRDRKGKTFVSQPYMRKGEKPFLVVTVSCPVMAKNGEEPIGLLFAQWIQEEFFKKLKSVATERAKGGQDIVLVNDHGQIVFHSNEQAWLAAGGGNDFQVPVFFECSAYSPNAIERYPDVKSQTSQSIEYTDPICGYHHWASAVSIKLENGQRFAVFAQQNDDLDRLWWRLMIVATILVVLGAGFVGMNSYALYWMLKLQREAVVHG
jgi:serine/threonine protein kinase